MAEPMPNLGDFKSHVPIQAHRTSAVPFGSHWKDGNWIDVPVTPATPTEHTGLLCPGCGCRIHLTASKANGEEKK